MRADNLGTGRPAGHAHDKRRNDQTGSGRPPKFYSVSGVAGMLDVSVRTVRRWIAQRQLAVHRFGGAVRISEPDLKTFLALHRDD